MHSRLLLPCLLVFLLPACHQRKVVGVNDPSHGVKIQEVTGVPVVFNDSITPPPMIKAGMPVVVPVKKPKGIAFGSDVCLVHEMAVDLHFDLSSFPVYAGGKNVYQSVENPVIEPVITVMGVPETIMAKDMKSKERNPSNFSYFNSKHGLPTSVVRDLLVDQLGQLWIATTGGVCRYDGRNFYKYTRKQGLLQNDIPALFEDRSGNIWFASYGGILSRFDGKQLTQYTYKDNIVFCITQDSRGNLWFGTKEGGVYYFDGEAFHDIEWGQGSVPKIVNTIVENPDGNIWIGTSEGVFIYDWTNIYRTGVSKPCGAIALDSLGQPWLGIENEIYHYNGSGYVRWIPEGCSFHSSITELYFDSFGMLWVGTANNGVARFDGKALSMFDHNSGFPGKRIENIVQDKTGNIWIGYSEGVCRYGGNLFTQYAENKNVAFTNVKEVFYDSKGRMWISSDGAEGVLCIDRDQIFEFGQEEGFRLSNPWSITEDSTGTIWFAQWNGGLCAFDGNTFSHYTIKQGLLSDSIWSIAADAAGNIWCTTNIGISKLAHDRSSFTNYTAEHGFGLDYRSITAGLHHDVWMTNDATGLIHFRNEPEGKIERYTIPGCCTGDLMFDHNGYLWFGAYENGLFCFDGKRIYHFTPEGLRAQNTFNNIEQDHQGNLWFATFASGLFKLDYRKFEDWKMQADSLFTSDSLWYPTDYSDLFSGFGSEEGFQAPIVMARASTKDDEGNLWFGTNDRIARVNASPEYVDSVRPLIKVTSIKLFNEQVDWLAVKHGKQRPIAENIDLGHIDFDSTSSLYNLPVDLKLPFADNNLNFEFGVVNLASRKNMVYQYMLEGIDKGWSTPTYNTVINYGHLSPGRYTFKVKGKSGYGYWSDISAFPFLIRPPWWRTWWAYLFYVVSLGALIYYFRRYELHRQQLRHHLELEKVEASKLKELDVVKSRLYTNITHEFRTPLTVILGMAEQIEKKPQQSVHDRIGLIRRNGRQLLSLVNQMLDLSKIESHQMKIHEIQSDIITYLRYIVESFHSMADAKDIQLKVIHPPGPIMMDYDPVKILQIISNLLSNAIKFTPAGGEIRLAIAEEDDHLKIKVSDTGIGIHADQVPFIFSRFYQADSSSTREGEGTGIGLTLTQELVKLLGGTIAVESQLNIGTNFTIELPVKRTAPIQTDIQIIEEGSVPSIHQNGVAEANTPEEISLNGDLPLLLIIEDNVDVTTYLVSCLEGQYQIVTAVNGQLGIDKALEIIPDIIITDVMMPLKDGFEVCDTLKKDTLTSHIPIIILTAKATVEDRIAGLERGADVYLAKPLHQEELIVQLRNLITSRQKLQERYRQIEAPVAQASPDEKIEDAFLLKFRNLIEAELDNADLSIDDMCRKMMMSRTQIHRKITALTDRSTSLYIRSIRLQHGKKLLQTTDLNVSEVAYRVGFDDPKYFSRVFQEEFQMAPSEAKVIQA